MSTQLYVLTHKQFQEPDNPMYIPLHVGRLGKKDLGYLGDDTGDNISHLNPYYAELTGLYWIWKNVQEVDYVGVCHYRRVLIGENQKAFGQETYETIFKEYDVVTSKRILLPNTYHDGFAMRHHLEDLLAVREAIALCYPEYLPIFDRSIHGKRTYFGNLMTISKPLFDQYCQWLFTIFEQASQKIHPENYDQYRMRVYGFISEILMMVWIDYHKLRPLECDVALIGEKAETHEVKVKVADLLERGKIQEAKSYFQQELEKRPDLLMDASDTGGELKLSMQMIATFDLEQQQTGQNACAGLSNWNQMAAYFRRLNTLILQEEDNPEISGLEIYSDIEKDIARMLIKKL